MVTKIAGRTDSRASRRMHCPIVPLSRAVPYASPTTGTSDGQTLAVSGC